MPHDPHDLHDHAGHAPDHRQLGAPHRGHDHRHSQDHRGHDHGHAHHGHSHDHGSGSEGRLRLALILTAGFMLAEVIGGLVSGSLALIADAGHMLTDAASLALALLALRISRRPVDDQRS
ncbi:UNVERIFIED_CONTAM: cation transporter, partial [Salmonella enterica subsp. enterica serovar Weltevreden]